VAMGVSHLQWKPGVGNLAGMPTTTAITTPTALAPSKKSNAVNWVETAKKGLPISCEGNGVRCLKRPWPCQACFQKRSL
jgi:hypothetical protein